MRPGPDVNSRGLLYLCQAMVYILNLETATTNCSVSLAGDGRVLVLKEDNSPKYSHAEKLHLFIDAVLREAGITPKELGAVAVSKGPGSFTGLRIGVSAAKGLSYALNIPLISVDTLKTMALQINASNGVIVPMLDARRQEVYTAIFDCRHVAIKTTWAEVLDENSFKEPGLAPPLYFIGDGALKAKDILPHENAVFKPEIVPSAKEMAGLSYQKFTAKDFEDVAYFEPFYLKDFMGKKMN